ncbi:MAG: MSCRAMM family protein, partial [Acidimicrobiales bacterium]
MAAAVPPVGSWRRAVALVAVLSLLAGLVLAVRGERAGALSPSSFDATDGVLDASATLLHALDQASGPSDDIYSGGGPKEDDLCPSVDPDHAAPPKADLTDFWLGVDRAGGEDFLYLAWQRQTTTGTATIDFELNQLATGCGNGANPVRAAGDLLFTYDFQGGNTIGIEVRSWNGTAWGAPMVLDSSTSEASISAGESFGELAINLHDAGIFVPGVCTSFASAFAKSRTGSGGAFSTSTIKDFISPIPAVVSNCALVVIDKRDDAGGPLAGAVFTLFTDNNGAPGTSTGKSCTTGASGACTIDDIFYGTYWLVETTTPAGHDTAPPQQVVVGPNGTTPPSPIPFVNPRQPGSVSIQKTDDAGAALAGATFTLYTDASNAPGTSTGQSCTTGAAGGCTITGVAAGTYWVVETTTPAGHTTVAPVKAQVGAGQAVNLALVDPRIPGQVNIHKTDDAGAALAGAVFTLYTDDANAPGTSTAKSCTTGASGDCTIGGILPGTYWVVETTTPAGHTTAAPQKVTVGLASTVDLTFVNPRIPSTIDIRKTDDAGANLAGAGFTLHTDLAGAPGASTGQS